MQLCVSGLDVRDQWYLLNDHSIVIGRPQLALHPSNIANYDRVVIKTGYGWYLCFKIVYNKYSLNIFQASM